MKILISDKELVGKTISFAHMAQFADTITLATTDHEVLMVTFGGFEEEGEIRILYPAQVQQTLQSDSNGWMRKKLSDLGIFDLEAYKKQEEERRAKKKIENEAAMKERDLKLLKQLVEKYPKEVAAHLTKE